MKTFIFYRSKTEDESNLRTFLHDLNSAKEQDYVLMDVNTRDGSANASLYDVVTYPTIISVGPEGQVMQEWRGVVPLLSEIRYYLHAR